MDRGDGLEEADADQQVTQATVCSLVPTTGLRSSHAQSQERGQGVRFHRCSV